MPLLTTKDLAAEMLLHPRTVKRWWRRLDVPPDACNGNGCHRWTEAGAARLFKAWRAYWLRADTDPVSVAQKVAGTFNPDYLQLLFNFNDLQQNEVQPNPNPTARAPVRGRHDLAAQRGRG